MGKAALAPLYISVAWTLMISYQLFTQTAVVTVVKFLNETWPSTISVWLASRVETIVFIHAFAWIFVLSSVIPSILLGKERSVLIQFFVCLTLTIAAFWIKDNLPTLIGGQPIENLISQIFSLAAFFHNPFLAGLYLSAPYLFMVGLDVHSHKNSKEKRIIKSIEAACFESVVLERERECLEA